MKKKKKKDDARRIHTAYSVRVTASESSVKYVIHVDAGYLSMVYTTRTSGWVSTPMVVYHPSQWCTPPVGIEDL